MKSPRLLHIAALGLLALTGAATVHAASVVTPVYPDKDTWVQNNATNDQPTNLILKASGTTNTVNQKKIFLKFTVTEAVTNGGRPRTNYPALLRLRKTSAPSSSGTEIILFAANNNWANPNFNWAGAPLATTELGRTTATGAQFSWVEFDVTSYISGPGTYSFCITSTTAGDVTFDSADVSGTTSDPYLEIEQETDPAGTDYTALINYFKREVVDVIADGNRYIARYKASNTGADDDIDKVGYFDATKQPYGLSTTGSAADNTWALRRVVNEARDARVAVYIPPGSYTINDQIQMIQGIVPMPASMPYPTETHGERWDLNDFPCVILGNADPASRSILVLASSASGFGDPNAPKPVLNFWSRFNTNGGYPKKNKLASHFNATLSHVDLNLNNNTGAIGVDMGGAQGTSLRNVSIYTGSGTFFAGVRGLPGPGGLTEKITVTGGQYGIYCTDAVGSVIPDLGFTAVVAASTFSGQTVNAVRWDGAQGLVMVGCDIAYGINDSTKAPIRVQGNTAVRGHLSLVDTKVSRTYAGPIVNGTRSVYMRDVFAENGDPIAQVENTASTAPTPIAGRTGGWLHVQEYYDGVHIQMFPGDSSTTGYQPTYINNSITSVSNGATKRNITSTEIPSDLISRHTSPPTLKWTKVDTSTVVNLKNNTTYPVLGDGSADDAANIQAVINAAAAAGKAVFVPRGEYVLEAGINLPNGVVVYGIDKSYSRLKAKPGIFSAAATYSPLVQAGAGNATDKHATTILADLMLFARMSEAKCYLLDWKIGRNSVVQNVNFDRRNVGSSFSMAHAMVLINGANAGGRWFNFWNDSDAAQQPNAYHHLEINGTREPLKFYMLNAETDTNTENIYLADAQNVDIYQTKWEADERDTAPFLRAVGCTDFRIFGFGGNAFMTNDSETPAQDSALKFTGCDRFLLATQAFQASANSGGFGTHNFFWVDDDGNTTPRKEQFVAFRVDQPRSLVAPASTAAEDGWILDGTTRTVNSTATGNSGLLVGDSTGAKQYRSVVSFDTSAIPGNATIVSAKLRLKVGVLAGSPGALGNLKADVSYGPFGAGSTLAGEDFDATATEVATFNVAAPTSGGGWIEHSLNAANLGSTINKGGRTQVRLSLATATDNDGVADTISFWAGEAAVPADRPVLEVFYYVP